MNHQNLHRHHVMPRRPTAWSPLCPPPPPPSARLSPLEPRRHRVTRWQETEPGNAWHHSSGKIMSSHRPEMGRQVCVCVCVLTGGVCVSLFVLLKSREIEARKRQWHSLKFKLQIAPVWSTPSRIWL